MRHGKFLVHKSEMNYINSFLKLLYSYLKVYEEENVKISKEITEIIDNICLFCVVWSIGAVIEEKSRILFNEFI